MKIVAKDKIMKIDEGKQQRQAELSLKFLFYFTAFKCL